MNVGPRPDGTIGPESSQRLLELGKWLATNGESIYGTRRGPIAPQPWGVSTAKGSKDRPSEIFLHILEPDAETPIILNEAAASLTPYLFGKDAPLRLTQSAGGMALDLPRDARTADRHDRRAASAGHSAAERVRPRLRPECRSMDRDERAVSQAPDRRDGRR